MDISNEQGWTRGALISDLTPERAKENNKKKSWMFNNNSERKKKHIPEQFWWCVIRFSAGIKSFPAERYPVVSWV